MYSITKKYYFVAIVITSIVLLTILVFNISYINPTTHLPKILWTYWDEETIPPFVNTVLNHRKKNLPNWTQIIVSDKTINQYVEPSEVYYTLGKTHKSDWLRLALLQKYGGCWMDASIIVNRETELNKMYDQSIRNQTEFTGFYTPLGVINNDRSSFIESWCLMAPRNSRFINTWLEEYEKACTLGFHVYKKESMKEHTFSPHIYNPEKTDDVYLTVYAACQITLQKRLRNQTNISLYNSYDTMYKLHYDCWDDAKKDYDHDCIVLRLRDDPAAKQIPFIKLTGHTRKFIEKVDISAFFIEKDEAEA